MYDCHCMADQWAVGFDVDKILQGGKNKIIQNHIIPLGGYIDNVTSRGPNVHNYPYRWPLSSW